MITYIAQPRNRVIRSQLIRSQPPPRQMREYRYARMRDMAKKIPPEMAELSVYVDKKLKLRFKLACTAQEKPMSEIIGLLMEQWLETTEAPPEAKAKAGENVQD